VIEIKPNRRVESCQEQIAAHKAYATKQGWCYTIWTEKELGFDNEHAITKWGDQFLSTIKSVDFVAERKLRSKQKAKKHYHAKIATDKVQVWCEYCHETHSPLRKSYDSNVARNGRYICEREGGHIAGSLPKKKKVNPYAVQGKKKCNGPCGEIKPLEEFGTDKGKPDGRASICKVCRAKKALDKYHAKKNKQPPTDGGH
jgi:hypothetical protein